MTCCTIRGWWRPISARRTKKTSASSSRSARRRRPRSRARLLAAAVAAAAAAGVVAFALRSGGADPGDPDEIGAPITYAVVYRVESPGGDAAVSTEVIRVERPFSSIVEVLAGAPPGGDRLSRRATRFGVLVVESDEAATRIAVPPALAGSDVRFDFLLDDALREGLVQRRGTRRIAGRSCRVYRAGGPVSAGELVPVDEGDGEHADVCIDGDGLVLEEEWFDGERLLRRRRAVAVDSKIDLPGKHFVLPAERDLSVESGNGAIRVLRSEERREALLFRFASPPEGFRLHGRYSVTHPRLGAPDAGRRAPVSGAAEVWVRGPDLIVLEQGKDEEGAGLPDHPYGREIDLGGLGRGERIVDLRGNEVRVKLDDGAYLRLYGTVPMRDLVALVRGLRRA